MEKKKKKFEPNAFVIIFCIMILCAILTWIIPAGSFDRAMDDVTTAFLLCIIAWSGFVRQSDG